MTASRAIRGTKVKLLFIFCVVFILAGIFTGVHNILVQLVELKESNAICHQQEENLSTQLQGKSINLLYEMLCIIFSCVGFSHQ